MMNLETGRFFKIVGKISKKGKKSMALRGFLSVSLAISFAIAGILGNQAWADVKTNTIQNNKSTNAKNIKNANIESAKLLVKRLAGLNSLEADFVQLSIDAKGLRVQELQGKAQLKRPNKMYWQTFQPFEQLMVTNGENVWFYEKDLEQVSVKKLDERSSATPLLILFENSTELEKSFDVEYRKQGGMETFLLTPKTKDTLFETLTLTFINSKFSKISLQDSLNQKTIINFQNTKFNSQIKDALFNFKIPAGVDIIETQ